MGWWIALLAVLLLAVLPLGVRLVYDERGAAVSLLTGPVRYKVFPGKKKLAEPEKEAAPEKKKAAKPAAKKKEPAKQEKKGGSWQDFLPLVRPVLNLLVDFRRKLRVDRLEMKLTLAGDDPADLAQNYGRAWEALGNLWPHLERLFVIKKRDVEIACDFTAVETKIYARIDLTITVWRILSLGLRHGTKLLKEFLRIRNQNKGGATI